VKKELVGCRVVKEGKEQPRLCRLLCLSLPAVGGRFTGSPAKSFCYIHGWPASWVFTLTTTVRTLLSRAIRRKGPFCRGWLDGAMAVRATLGLWYPCIAPRVSMTFPLGSVGKVTGLLPM
jgi:hypothetical protein